MSREALDVGARKHGFTLTQEQLEQFACFSDVLEQFSQQINLTTVPREEYVERHFLDSLALSHQRLTESGTLLDVGSGAGFPGIPCAIALPNLKVTLLEATGKRVDFLRHVAQKCRLGNVSVVQGRAEDVAHKPQFRERFERVVARAVARAITLAELTIPFASLGGLVLLVKGQGATIELREATEVIAQLGAEVQEVVATGSGNILVLEKKRPTPLDRPLPFSRLRQREAKVAVAARGKASE